MTLRRTLPFEAQQGYVSIAQNSDVDYLKLAYLQALSIKATQKINNYAIIVDKNTEKEITDTHRKVFDKIVVLPFEDDAYESTWKLQNEWQVWWATPWKETIKLEADLILPVNIDHWWNMLRHRDICFSVIARTYRGDISKNKRYRKVFDDNFLPNAYNGFSYFRYSRTSADFFMNVREILKNQESYKKILKNFNGTIATDEAYALAAVAIGTENCYIPHTDYPCLTHMKPGIHEWDECIDWMDVLPYTINDDLTITVGGYTQQYPFHYHNKEFATDKIIGKYERIVF